MFTEMLHSSSGTTATISGQECSNCQLNPDAITNELSVNSFRLVQILKCASIACHFYRNHFNSFLNKVFFVHNTLFYTSFHIWKSKRKFLNRNEMLCLFNQTSRLNFIITIKIKAPELFKTMQPQHLFQKAVVLKK